MKQVDESRGELERLTSISSRDQVSDFESQHNINATHDDILDDVQQFADECGLNHKIDLFRKASFLVQGELPIHQIPGITTREVRAVQDETHRKWHQPKLMYLTIIATAFGSMGQGWAQTSMNGANLTFPATFGIDSKSPHDNFIVGLINCGIYLSNGLIGCWLVAPLNNRFGRRGAVFGAAAVSLLSNLGCALTSNWQQLLVFRFLLGCALGIISSTLNVFAAECAPAAIRGGLAVSWQMFCAFGIFLGFVANLVIDTRAEDFGPDRWRPMLAAPALSMVPLLIVIYICPESPSWYIKHSSSYDLAFESLSRLRNTELQAARELYLSHNQQKPFSKLVGKSSYLKSLMELFTIPRIRRATVAAYTTMLGQQLCGINIIAFYSSSIFRDAGFSPFAALLASTIFGLVNFLGAFPAIWTMDTLGRRSLLLYTLPPMAITMALAGLSFSIPEASAEKVKFGMLASMIYLFCALYSPGMGPVPCAYSAEVFPLSHREIGTASTIAVANIFATILSVTFPALLSALGSQGSFLLYAALNVIAWILVFLFVQETKRRTLEELDHVFSASTWSFIQYQVTEYAPWWTRRYLLRQKNAELKSQESEAGGQYSALGQEDQD